MIGNTRRSFALGGTKAAALGLSVLTLVFGMSLAIAGCDDGSKDDGNKGGGGGTIPTELVGKWGYSSTNTAQLEINSDGSGKLGTSDATWSVSGTTLTVTVTIAGTSTTGSATWAIDSDGKLTLSDPQGTQGAALTATCAAGALENLGGTSSGTGDGTGTNKVATPTASPGAGTYSSAQSVTLSCTTSGAEIYYTINGDTPTTSSTKYTAAISVSATTTIKAIAVKDGMTNSDVLTAVYTINISANKVATPTASPAGGTYTEAQRVTLSCATDGATIWYSTDGTNPTQEFTPGTSITVAATTTLKARAGKSDMTNSDVMTETYTINLAPAKWVGVGQNGTISISTNGTTWSPVTLTTNPSNFNIRGVAYGNNTWVAVGAGGNIVYSTDGISWTKITTTPFGANTNDINGVAFGNSRFVAVGKQGKAAYSTDGISWTLMYGGAAGSTFGSSDINGVVYDGAPGAQMFVMYGYAGKMAASTTGLESSWTEINATTSTFGTGTSTQIQGVVYGNNTWVAYGILSNSPHVAHASSPTTTWTMHTPGTSAGQSCFSSSESISSIFYNNTQFVAFGGTGSTNKIVTSTDGASWSQAQNPGNICLGRIVYGDNKWVGLGNGIMLSTDGTSWQQVSDSGVSALAYKAD